MVTQRYLFRRLLPQAVDRVFGFFSPIVFPCNGYIIKNKRFCSTHVVKPAKIKTSYSTSTQLQIFSRLFEKHEGLTLPDFINFCQVATTKLCSDSCAISPTVLYECFTTLATKASQRPGLVPWIHEFLTREQQFLSSWDACISPQLSTFEEGEFMQLLHSHNQLQLSPAARFSDSWLNRFSSQLEKLKPRNLVGGVRLLAGLGVALDENFLVGWSQVVNSRLPKEFGPEAVASTIGALANVGLVPGSFDLESWYTAVERMISNFSVRELPVLFCSFGRLKQVPKTSFLNLFYAASRPKLIGFLRQDLVELLYAHAELGLTPTPAWWRWYLPVLKHQALKLSWDEIQRLSNAIGRLHLACDDDSDCLVQTRDLLNQLV